MRLKKILQIAFVSLLFCSCEVTPNLLGSKPGSLPSAKPTASPSSSANPSAKPTTSPGVIIPSEAPSTDSPACLQSLQCIVDNTTNNGLRKQTQEIINQLFVLADPDYTNVCKSRSMELLEKVPECLR